MSIDFSKGGYAGDGVEAGFEEFTKKQMPYWWHMREVLRASHAASQYWMKTDGSALADAEQRELVAISLLSYSVYTGIADALGFFSSLQTTVDAPNLSPVERMYNARRVWKAAYSSLYSSFNALSNICCVIIGGKPYLEVKKDGSVWNYTPAKARNLAEVSSDKQLSGPLSRCYDRCEIRSHLDHYWVIWTTIGKGVFLMDENFEKGYVPLYPDKEVKPTREVIQQLDADICGFANDFNLTYREIAVDGGWLDKYLSAKGWTIDYSDYGAPHNGRRPLP